MPIHPVVELNVDPLLSIPIKISFPHRLIFRKGFRSQTILYDIYTEAYVTSFDMLLCWFSCPTDQHQFRCAVRLVEPSIPVVLAVDLHA